VDDSDTRNLFRLAWPSAGSAKNPVTTNASKTIIGFVFMTFPSFFPLPQECRNAVISWDVMLSESEASAFLMACAKADSSAAPQNDILT
jgi:hypothetical protein